MGEAAEGQAGSFLVADPLLDLERLGVPRLGGVEVAGDGVNRERLDPGGDVHRVAREPLGLDDHLADVDTDGNRNALRRELPLDRDCGEHRTSEPDPPLLATANVTRMSRPLGEAERVADQHSAQRSEKEISMRLRSPRTLAAGATAVVLLAGGATAFAKSGSSSPGPSTKGPSVERALFAATLGRGLAATAMVRRVAVTRAVADCGPPVPLGDPFKAAADYLGLSVAQLANKFQGGASLADIAAQQGKSVDGLEQALIDAAKSDLDKSVAAGDMTADQEQQVLGQLSSQIDDFVNGNGGLTIRIGKGDLTLRIGGPGPGGMLDGPYKTAADYLGLSVDQLAKDLQAGKSLADVAADQGKSVDGLKQALVQAETAEIEKSVDDLVNQKGLAGPPCGGGVVGAAGIEVPRFGTPGTP